MGVAWEVRRFAEVGSTQTWLAEAARRGAPHGLVVSAEVQREGRGRLERRFEADAGAAVLVSVLVRLGELAPLSSSEEAVARAGALAPALALAALGACRDVLGRRAGRALGLVWPNDLVGASRKLGGVLAEAGRLGQPDAWVVAGVGINVRPSLSWGPEVRSRATSLVELGWPAEQARPTVVEERLLSRLGRLAVATASQAGRARLRGALVRRSATLGHSVVVRRLAGEVVEGVALDLDEAYRLVVETKGGQRVVLSEGDVERSVPVGCTGPSSRIADC